MLNLFIIVNLNELVQSLLMVTFIYFCSIVLLPDANLRFVTR